MDRVNSRHPKYLFRVNAFTTQRFALTDTSKLTAKKFSLLLHHKKHHKARIIGDLLIESILILLLDCNNSMLPLLRICSLRIVLILLLPNQSHALIPLSSGRSVDLWCMERSVESQLDRISFLRSLAASGTTVAFWGLPLAEARATSTNDLQASLESIHKDAKKLGRDLSQETKKMEKSVKKETKKATKEIKKEVKKVDKIVTKETKKATKEIKQVEKKVTKETQKAMRTLDTKTKGVQQDTQKLGTKLGVLRDGSTPKAVGIDTSKLKVCTDSKTKCLK